VREASGNRRQNRLSRFDGLDETPADPRPAGVCRVYPVRLLVAAGSPGGVGPAGPQGVRAWLAGRAAGAGTWPKRGLRALRDGRTCGAQGPAGTGFNPKGSALTFSALQPQTQQGPDAYIVQDEGDTLYVWDAAWSPG